jgi:hypothetical protein
MNVRLQYNLEFSGAVHIDGHLQLNQYQVNLNLETCTRDRAAINIAMDRLRFFVNVELANAVYINQSEHDLAEILQMIGANVVTLPDEPVDQIVGLMLYCKLNAVMEGMMTVTALDISSSLGDDVWYEHTEEDALGPFFDPGWWNQATTVHNDLDTADRSNKVVKVVPDSWTEYGLSWPDLVDKDQEKAHTVVYAKFPKHEN